MYNPKGDRGEQLNSGDLKVNKMSHNKLKVLLFIAGLLFFPYQTLQAQLPKLIPSQDKHAPFLVGSWKPSKKTLVVFKDPYCEHCLAELPFLKKLTDYNVFLFWAPILGQASVRKVDEMMRCSWPLEEDLLQKIRKGESTGCNGPIDKSIVQLNQNMIKAYNPQVVPLYYLHGRSISSKSLFAGIRKKTFLQVAESSKLRPDWSRYQLSKIRNNLKIEESVAVAILIPGNWQLTATMIETLPVEANIEWYLFWNPIDENMLSGLCEGDKVQPLGFCVSPRDNADLYREQTLEFFTLLGVEDLQTLRIFINGLEVKGNQIDFLFTQKHASILNAAMRVFNP